MSDVAGENTVVSELRTRHSSLNTYEWGMASFLVSEVALFSTLIVVYVTYIGADRTGPTPAILTLPLAIGTTICLLASSVTVHVAVKALAAGNGAAFHRWWSATILLGIVFLAGTAYEWHDLIVHHDLTISRNLFGTTFYTLVGFHGLHVTIGVVVMIAVLGLTLSKGALMHGAADLVSWYWHFVDGVWIVVFAVVYLAGR